MVTKFAQEFVRGPDGKDYRRAWTPGASSPIFVPGVSIVTPELSGWQAYALKNDRDPEEPLTPYTGAGAGGLLATASAGEEFHWMDFGTTRIALQGTGQKVTGSNFRQTRTDYGGSFNMIDVGNANTRDAFIEGNSIENVANTYQASAGIGGHHFTARWNFIKGFVDGIGMYNATGDAANKAGYQFGVAEYNYIADMAFFWAATTGVVHPSDTGVHSDGFQMHNGRGWIIRYNTINARWSTTVGNVDKVSYTINPVNGKLPNGGTLTGIALTQPVGPVSEIICSDNVIYTGLPPLNFYSTPTAGYTTLGEVERNRIDRTHGTTQSPYLVHSSWTGDLGLGAGNPDANTYFNTATGEREEAIPVTRNNN